MTRCLHAIRIIGHHRQQRLLAPRKRRPPIILLAYSETPHESRVEAQHRTGSGVHIQGIVGEVKHQVAGAVLPKRRRDLPALLRLLNRRGGLIGVDRSIEDTKMVRLVRRVSG